MKATEIDPSWCKLSLKGAKFKVENDGGPGEKGSLKSVKNPALLFAAKFLINSFHSFSNIRTKAYITFLCAVDYAKSCHHLSTATSFEKNSSVC